MKVRLRFREICIGGLESYSDIYLLSEDGEHLLKKDWSVGDKNYEPIEISLDNINCLSYTLVVYVDTIKYCTVKEWTDSDEYTKTLNLVTNHLSDKLKGKFVFDVNITGEYCEVIEEVESKTKGTLLVVKCDEYYGRDEILLAKEDTEELTVGEFSNSPIITSDGYVSEYIDEIPVYYLTKEQIPDKFKELYPGECICNKV